MTKIPPKLCLYMQNRIEEQIADMDNPNSTREWTLAGFTEEELRTIQMFIRSFEHIESFPEDYLK